MSHHNICIVACSPSSQKLLASFHGHTPPGVLLLPSGMALPEQLDISCGLLILVAHQVSEQDSEAILATAAQLKARSFGIPIVCVVTLPPPSAKSTQLQCALHALQAHADTHILLPSNTKVDLKKWLTHAVTDMAKGMDDSASIGVEIAELSSILRSAGKAVWVSAETRGEHRALEVTHQILSHDFVQGQQLLSARHAVTWITAAPQALKLREMRDVLAMLNQTLHPDTKLPCGVVYDRYLSDTLRLTVLFAGISDCSSGYMDCHG